MLRLEVERSWAGLFLNIICTKHCVPVTQAILEHVHTKKKKKKKSILSPNAPLACLHFISVHYTFTTYSMYCLYSTLQHSVCCKEDNYNFC